MRVLLFVLWCWAIPVQAQIPRVATDIAPVAALVADVMAGLGAPEIIVPPGVSPHDHAMRPSQAGALAEADLVVWVGPSLTPGLARTLESLAPTARRLQLTEVKGTRLLPMRKGELFAAHDHDGHDHAEIEEGNLDPHAWLDPENARIWVAAIAEELAQRDPENAETYRGNAVRVRDEIAQVAAEIAETLAPFQDAPFIVLHDGFQYFEAHFGIEAMAAVTDGDAAAPGAGRIAALRAHLADRPPRCAFSEPQSDPRLLATVTEGLQVRTATLDPLGDADGAGYANVLRAMAATMAACFKA